MSEPTNNTTPAGERPGFPFITVAAAVVTMLAFLALTWAEAEYRFLSNALKSEQKADKDPPKEKELQLDPAAKLDGVNKRNEAALKGVGAKMSRDEARAKLLTTLKGPNDKLPFPMPEPKKEEKKDDKKDSKKPEDKEKKKDEKGDEP
jgi:hypothetical protein